MTAPPKPWEVGVNSRCMGGIPGVNNVTDSNRLHSSSPMSINPTLPVGGVTNVRRVVRTVPAPPPRPYNSTVRRSYIPSPSYNMPYSYGTGYGGYSGMGTSGYYGSYGGFGNFGGYGMNRFGNTLQGNDPENRFIQMAEESSRPAFQSIESVVHAFGSFSFMLESTFNALYGSFRAVLSVAENFGRLRTLFGQFFSTFAVLRTLQWLYRKLLYLLGLRKVNPGREDLWQQAMASEGNLPPGVETKNIKSSWPILVFMGIMVSGPYLAWKLLNSVSSSASANASDPKNWNKSKDPTYSAVALYDFVAESNQELNFKAGQTLHIAPKELQPQDVRGWMLATANGKDVGLVPYNYIRLMAIGLKNVQESVNTHMGQATVPNQHIPTMTEHLPTPAPTPMMETGWVPEPLNSQVHTAVPVVHSVWTPTAATQNPGKSHATNSEKAL